MTDVDERTWVDQALLLAAYETLDKREAELAEAKLDRSLALELMTSDQRVQFWGIKTMRERGELTPP